MGLSVVEKLRKYSRNLEERKIFLKEDRIEPHENIRYLSIWYKYESIKRSRRQFSSCCLNLFHQYDARTLPDNGATSRI